MRALDNEIKDMLVKLLERQTKLEHEINEIKMELKKGSIELETILKNVNTTIDGQTAHKDQRDLLTQNTNSIIYERTELIEAVTSVSEDVKEIKESVNVIFMEKVINEIRKFYKQNGYDFVKSVNINDLIEGTELSESQISKVVKELQLKKYILEYCWIDKNGCEFYLNDLGKEKLLPTGF
mgnify:CR=1 FL=1